MSMNSKHACWAALNGLCEPLTLRSPVVMSSYDPNQIFCSGYGTPTVMPKV